MRFCFSLCDLGSVLTCHFFIEQQELYEEINQSRLELEEQGRAHASRPNGSEMEQRERLAALGLSEVEAVEYVLMVSRDEEEQRRHAMGSSSTDEGVFSVDSDDLLVGRRRRALPSSRRSSAGQHSASSDSNCKVQISPRSRPEPMEAGTVSTPPAMAAPVRTDDGVLFPAIKVANKGASPAVSVESAWRTPLRAGGSAASSRIGVDHADRVEAVGLRNRSFDEELSMAIELSLRDARNGGDRERV